MGLKLSAPLMQRTTIFWAAVFLMAALSVDAATGMWLSLFKFGDVLSTPMQRLKWLAPIAIASLMCLAAVDWRRVSKSCTRDLFFAAGVAIGMLALEFAGILVFGLGSNGFVSFVLLALAMITLNKSKLVQNSCFANGLFLFAIGPALIFV